VKAIVMKAPSRAIQAVSLWWSGCKKNMLEYRVNKESRRYEQNHLIYSTKYAHTITHRMTKNVDVPAMSNLGSS
jgi:hypothetical protein